jgi:UTP--glucose-1-phosphate uridylyltransferase
MAPLKVRKAVIPAAGHGDPFSSGDEGHAQRDASAGGQAVAAVRAWRRRWPPDATEVIIITGRGKVTMEDHFDRAPELEASLDAARQDWSCWRLCARHDEPARTYQLTTRQSEPLGLGHAVLQAKQLIGDEPFAVILPDDVV